MWGGGFKLIATLLNIKGINLSRILELNNILLFLTFMCQNYYFNTQHVIKKTITSNQPIFVIELLGFKVNKVRINVCT